MQSNVGRTIKSELNLLALLAQLKNSKSVSVECPACGLSSSIGSISRIPRLDGTASVGWVCTHCHMVVESYRTNRQLDEMQEKLARYRKAASKGGKFFERYKRYQARYQAQFDQANR